MPLDALREAPWNPNSPDDATHARLKTSLDRYGLVQNLVVRRLEDATFEVLSGNQRLRILRESGVQSAPCVVVEADDGQARLLAQALNRIHGEDDLGLRAELVRKVMEDIPEAQVLSLLPETAESLKSLAVLDQQDMEEYLNAWQKAQAAKLRHLTFQLVDDQLHTVVEALERVGEVNAGEESNPSRRGNALYALCRQYLEVAS